MSGITFSEIGDEVLGDVEELLKPAVENIKLDKETIEGELVSTMTPACLI